MHFIYGPETRTPGDLGAHFARMNPNEKYMGHFINLIALDELARKYASHKGTARQIEKEMEICRRKLRWWSARPGFSRDLITVLSKTAPYSLTYWSYKQRRPAMTTYMIQISLGHLFHDMYVTARSEASALRKARIEVAKNDGLKTFRHRFTNYVL